MAGGTSVDVEQVEGAETAILREPATGSEARVVVAVGSNAAAFRTRVAGREVDVLAAPPDMATLRERPTRWGTGVLFPYPGRIRGGRFTFRGREVTLPTAADGNAIHGVARNRPWRVVHTGEGTVTTELDSRAAGVPAEEWPWPFVLRLTTSLIGGVLRVAPEATNTGKEPMPMGIGFHPYFPIHDDCRVWVEADELWEQEGQGLPTGKREELGPEDGLRRPKRLADVPATIAMPEGNVRNMLFRRRSGGIAAGIQDPRTGVETTLRAGPEFPAMVFFTPTAPPLVSLEPHSCVPDAFNLAARGVEDAGMVVLPPGGRWASWFEIAARPVQ